MHLYLYHIWYIYIYDSSLMIFHLVRWFSRNLHMEEVPRRIGWWLWVTVVDWCRCGNSRCQGSKMVGFARKNVGFSLEKWWVWPGTMLISPWNMWLPPSKTMNLQAKSCNPKNCQAEKNNHLPNHFCLNSMVMFKELLLCGDGWTAPCAPEKGMEGVY